jgi:ribosomal protein L29
VAADALRAAVRSQLRFVLPVLGGAALLLLYLVAFKHARFDGATAALVVSAIALVACLRALYRIVHALAQPNLQTIIEQAGELGSASDRELREERRRLLRALNELRFDHEMGKLSLADYDKVREGYELRAIEVMRRLDAGRGVHPELAKRLGLADGVVVEPAPSEVPTDRLEVPRDPSPSGESTPEQASKSVAEEAG